MKYHHARSMTAELAVALNLECIPIPKNTMKFARASKLHVGHIPRLFPKRLRYVRCVNLPDEQFLSHHANLTLPTDELNHSTD